MKYGVSYGKKELEVEVSKKRVVGTLAPKAVDEVADVQKAVENAIKRPHKSEPLASILEGKKSAIVLTVDNTRPSPAPLLKPVLTLCDKLGVKTSVMVAPGRHRLMKDAEIEKHLTKSITSKYTILQHDAFDDKSMVSKGKTKAGTKIKVNKAIFEHDIVIGVGIIEPSYLCGWSGGRKLLLPGIAHHESIDNNHFFLTQPGAEIGTLHGNPVSDDAADFASGLPYHFIVYSVSGPNDEVAEVIAGDPVEAHEKACKKCEKIFKVKGMEADIVISTSGGHPYDWDLVQGKKAIIPAIKAVKRNGVIILSAQCPDGLGAEKTFINWLSGKTPLEVTTDVKDRKQFNLGAHGANILAKPIVEKNAKVFIVTSKDVAAELRGTYITPFTKMEDAFQAANMICGKDSSVLFIDKARRLIVK